VKIILLIFFLPIYLMAFDEPLRADSHNANWPVCKDKHHNLNPNCGDALSMSLFYDTEDRATQHSRDGTDSISSCSFSSNACRVYDQAQVMVATDVLTRAREIVVKSQQDILKSVKNFKACIPNLPASYVTCPANTSLDNMNAQQKCACVRDQLPKLSQKFTEMRVFRALATSNHAETYRQTRTSSYNECGAKIEAQKICVENYNRSGCKSYQDFPWSGMVESADRCLINGQPRHDLTWIERNFGSDVSTMADLSASEFEAAKSVYRNFKRQSSSGDSSSVVDRVNGLKEQAQSEYQNLLIDYPVFNYIGGPTASNDDYLNAFTKVEQNLSAEITRVRGDKDLGSYLRYDSAIQQAIAEVNSGDSSSTGDYCEVVNRMYREDEGWKTASQVGIVGLGLVTMGAGTLVSVGVGAATEAYNAYTSISEFNRQAAVCRSGGSTTSGALCSVDRLSRARDNLYGPVDAALGIGGMATEGLMAARIARAGRGGSAAELIPTRGLGSASDDYRLVGNAGALEQTSFRSTEIEAENRRVLAEVKRMGIKVDDEYSGRSTILSNMRSRGEVSVTSFNPSKGVNTGIVMRVTEPPSIGILSRSSSNAMTPAFTHPDFAAKFRELQENGVDVIVDTSMRKANAGGYFSAARDGERPAIALSPDTPWNSFVHEYQHYEFSKLDFNNIRMTAGVSLNSGENFSEVLSRTNPDVFNQIGPQRLAKLDSYIKRGILDKLALDESLAVDQEVASLGWKTYTPDGALAEYQANRYKLDHQVDGLNRQIAAINGNAAIPQRVREAQLAVLNRTLAELSTQAESDLAAIKIRYPELRNAQVRDRNLAIAGGIAGAGAIAWGAYTKIFYDQNSNVIGVKADGSVDVLRSTSR
jgi:hypothetical protein